MKTRAQSSLEFLYTVSFMVLLMTMCMLIYFQSANDSAVLSAYSESRRICQAVSALISSADAAGDGASIKFARPPSLADMNYSIYIMGSNRSIAVSYADQGTGCLFSTTNISNGSSSAFYVSGDAVVRNAGGGVLFG
ncbi:TPA: hypothetical protein HA225_02180 [Candidatus Micrarchaeota archaeon]|nr:hypothetical protein [Candidatus Micrarchaeota archaeon]HIH30724.1 hypothetical protein [Candidatus Micrarchaeota archaeon]